jgi:hypothetical protein
MDRPVLLVFVFSVAAVTGDGRKQPTKNVSQTAAGALACRVPDQALLNLTCSDIEKIVYARLNWPR